MAPGLAFDDTPWLRRRRSVPRPVTIAGATPMSAGCDGADAVVPMPISLSRKARSPCQQVRQPGNPDFERPPLRPTHGKAGVKLAVPPQAAIEHAPPPSRASQPISTTTTRASAWRASTFSGAGCEVLHHLVTSGYALTLLGDASDRRHMMTACAAIAVRWRCPRATDQVPADEAATRLRFSIQPSPPPRRRRIDWLDRAQVSSRMLTPYLCRIDAGEVRLQPHGAEHGKIDPSACPLRR